MNRSRSTPAKLCALATLSLVVGAYLAGYLLLWQSGASPLAATPMTVFSVLGEPDPDPMQRGRVALSITAGAAASIAILLAALLPRRKPLHGDARFASTAEARAAGLLAERGIVLGRLGNQYLTLSGQQGVLLAAPPRSGKGVGVVIPNCLNWADSLVCIDIKGENWAVTAGYRAECGQSVYRFDPFSENGQTMRWNPFTYVSEDRRLRINDLQRIAQMLYPDPPGVDPFWTASARSLFLGIALYLFETPAMPRTLGEVLRQGMASDDEGFGAHWKRIIEGRTKAQRPLSSECVQALYDVIDLAPVTASSIRKTFTSRLDLWLNPMLDAATAANDVDFRDLRRRPISIYVCVNPDDIHRLRPVLNLFFQQAIGLQTRTLPEHDESLRHQVLMLLDEFTALGRIPIIAESIAFLPGYNIRTLLVVQTPAQLREVYGRDGAETLAKSLAARIVFAPKDVRDALEISEELGFTTVPTRTVSRARGLANRTPSESIGVARRALMLPQEVKELGSEEAIVFYEGLRPILCQKIRYHRDRHFKRRLRETPKVTVINWQETPRGQREVFEAPEKAESRDTARPRSGRQWKVPPEPPPREPTLTDLPDLGDLCRDDFDVDFEAVQIPSGSRLEGAALQSVVQQLMTGADTGSSP